MILYTFSLENVDGSWSTDFELMARRELRLPETFLSAKTVTTGTGDGKRDFVQVAFEPGRPGPFVGSSCQLGLFLAGLGKRFGGTLHSVSVTSTERNPLMAEVPDFD